MADQPQPGPAVFNTIRAQGFTENRVEADQQPRIIREPDHVTCFLPAARYMLGADADPQTMEPASILLMLTKRGNPGEFLQAGICQAFSTEEARRVAGQILALCDRIEAAADRSAAEALAKARGPRT